VNEKKHDSSMCDMAHDIALFCGDIGPFCGDVGHFLKERLADAEGQMRKTQGPSAEL